MTRTIRGLRILPPFAIARLGSADEPMDNYTIELDAPANQDRPLGYRALKPLRTLIVGERSGEIEDARIPTLPLKFTVDRKDEKDGKNRKQIRPVAPFLEVFAVIRSDKKEDELVPLTVELLSENGLSVKDVSWTVRVANRKVARRTGDENDVVATRGEVVIADHDIHALHGYCNNFESPDSDTVDFGQARFIKPNAEHPEIRLRFTPARGLIYGPGTKSGQQVVGSYSGAGGAFVFSVDDVERSVYGRDKGIWIGYPDPPAPVGISDEAAADKFKADWKAKREQIWNDNGWPTPDKFDNETLPPGLYAINPPAPSWLYDNVAISRGYLDDACDGFVEVRVARPGEDPETSKLKARARICSGPPAMAPDSLFVRTLADDLDQVVFGPDVDQDVDPEDPEITRTRAQDIVRRAFETVRFMNVAVMNGNDFKGRPALSLDSMPEEEAADTERAIRPVMHPGAVDTKAVTALHQQAYAALRAGTAPWFVRLLRRPDKAADFTDHGRRKMPALMCGADNNYLALTWRQIHTIEKAATDPHPSAAVKPVAVSHPLTPRNLSAQIHHEAKGNPISSRPITSVANCCPGLEVDFRAVWRRLFKGIELREYDNLVVRLDPDKTMHALASRDGTMTLGELQGKRLLRVVVGKEEYRMMTHISGPASSDPDGRIQLTTDMNPAGLAPLEWSNALAYVLRHAGKTVGCDFSKDDGWDQQQPLIEANETEPAKYVSFDLEVRSFFEDDTAVISRALAEAGELTQGLCSPWQNDYRECSCYYWASARPDFVNVEFDSNGLSAGDNWFQRTRTGSYVPDDYADSRLIMYDELFRDWEKALKFQIGGRDAPDSSGEVEAGKKG
ncbi:MAG: hypothetical protein JO223_20195 [Hyphomicrobiales bacterium]|nr:hypothetical protein [Hyphomicrobiales bacterium]MBV8439846.1 hypothetical protein [Hyphomicrobiales bacterium]